MELETLNIAVGAGANAKRWKNTSISWGDLVAKLRTPVKTQETHRQFMAAPREDQSKIKDVGGYVGGYLQGGKRGKGSVGSRQLFTLDLDFANMDLWDDYVNTIGAAAVLHGTHKHSEESPRFRLIMPADREMTPDEYEAAARKIAGKLDIELFDPTTFQPSRLMFWPSISWDSEYYFETLEGEPICVDDLLDEYTDWKDVSEWPTLKMEGEEIRDRAAKQEDPLTKKGYIGIFCRAFSIHDAIDTFLSDAYTSAGDDRYTYVQGSTSAGLVIYDDKFAYSNHGTDPISGQLCNAFDIVRIHKFGYLDEGSRAKGDKLPSFVRMTEFLNEQPEYKKQLAREKISEMNSDFEDDSENPNQEETISEEDVDWMSKLDCDKGGNIKPTEKNIRDIFKNDPRIKGAFKKDLFSDREVVVRDLPWRKLERDSRSQPKPRMIEDADDAQLRSFFGIEYKISVATKVMDAFQNEIDNNRFHPVRDYLKNLEWDGVERIDKFLIDYFGAEDNLYTREAMRVMMLGAVGRVMDPGCKFDLVLVLASEMQGTGKSSFFNWLASDAWFSDSFAGFNGKAAIEQLQGSWILEMGELKGLKKAEVESVKQFISARTDKYRKAYGKRVTESPRQTILVASTNEPDFNRDATGGRRFIPVDVAEVKLYDNDKLRKLVLPHTDEERRASKDFRNQLWAEAMDIYSYGGTLKMSKEAEKYAEKVQSEHTDVDERVEWVKDYIICAKPKNWYELDKFEKRAFLANEEDRKNARDSNKKIYLDSVCAREIWELVLGGDDLSRYDGRKSREISVLIKLTGVVENSKPTPKRTRDYGLQRSFTTKGQ